MNVNIGAKSAISKKLSSTLLTPSHARQLSDMIGNTLTHETVKDTVSSAKTIINFLLPFS